MGAKTERRGLAYGNARGSERQKRRRENHLADPRVATALAEVRQHQAQIDAMIEAGESIPRPKLVYVKPEINQALEVAATPEVTKVAQEAARLAELKIDWSMRDVYSLLYQGYTCKGVASRTGYEHDIVFSVWSELIDQWCDEEDEEVDDAEDQQD